MTGRLEQKVAIVTGAASGIGRATARLFAAKGAADVLADGNTAQGEEAAQEIVAGRRPGHLSPRWRGAGTRHAFPD
jgi:NAD(P)-dependent dehydrogenase (short-subunit alcohol dehydrogenase family)